MSKADTNAIAVEETFASKAGIEMGTPRTFEDLIEKFAGTKYVACAMGPSGIGKTAIPKQVAARRNKGKGVPYVALHVPTMTLEDCHIPTMAADTKEYYDRRISRRFQKLLNWVEEHKNKKTGKLDPDLVPILAVEELNRAVDKSVTRALFTLLDDRMIGDIQLDPESIQLVVTMNPTGGGMAVNEFERDPAMRRRLVMVGITHSAGDFLKYANDAKFHQDVLAHLQAMTSHIYDETAAASGKAFACPATWEAVSNICKRWDELGENISSASGRAALSGCIGTGSTTTFLEYVKNNTLVIAPDEVLTGYDKTSEVRKRFKGYLTDGGGRLDKVTELCSSVAIKVFVDMKNKKPETISKQMSWFLGDLPVEVMMSFIQKLTEEGNRLGNDAKSYMQQLNIEMAKDQPFQDGLKRLHDAKLAVEKETSAKKDKEEKAK